jgi:hypothetical protein
VAVVIDVHAPHEPVLNWRDFLIHLATITIGLLIALSLEGCVEWQHHRHLVQDAEASLQAEIENNAKDMTSTFDDLHKQQSVLKQDLVVLSGIQKNHNSHSTSLSVTYGVHGFEDVGWKTAQSTGAFSYMPYDRAQEYSDIYETQTKLQESEQQAARDAVVALAPFYGGDDKDGPDFSPGSVKAMEEKIEILQAQLLLVDGFMKGLDGGYRKLLAAHPH